MRYIRVLGQAVVTDVFLYVARLKIAVVKDSFVIKPSCELPFYFYLLAQHD